MRKKPVPKVVAFAGFVLVILYAAVPVFGEESSGGQQAPEKAATVNGVAIDRGELDGEIFAVQKALLGYGKPLTAGQVSSIQTEVLESMIRREILYQESRKSGIKPDENAVNKELKALKDQFPNETEFKNELVRRHVSEEILRFRLERNSAVQQYIDRNFATRITIADSEMVTYYEGHLDAFKQPPQACAGHIFVRTDPKGGATQREEGRKKAEQILGKLKKGQDFAELAREYSDGPTRTSGGDLGCLRPGQLDKEFESLVFGLKPGNITDVIDTEHGFHIFKVTDKKAETILAYESVKEKIRLLLVAEKARQEADLQARKLREQADVQILVQDKSSK